MLGASATPENSSRGTSYGSCSCVFLGRLVRNAVIVHVQKRRSAARDLVYGRERVQPTDNLVALHLLVYLPVYLTACLLPECLVRKADLDSARHFVSTLGISLR